MANPLAENQNEQLFQFSDEQFFYDEMNNLYAVDETLDTTTDYNFRDPDFSFAQFRSNLVVRYEYKPGSEIFLVWAQGITDYGSPNGSLYSSF